MAEVVKIVLTGGPCGGKSTAIKYIYDVLTNKYGLNVSIIDEVATRLYNEGKSPKKMGNYEIHKLLFDTHLSEELEKTAICEKMDCEKAILLSDRGLLDNRAFVTQEDFDRYAGLHNLNEDFIRNSYDGVFHLVTAANGAEKFYTLENNQCRSETIEEARILDEEIMAVWTGTPHLRVIDNSTDFDGKLQRLMTEILALLGIPEPLEIERKFLIEYPDIEFLENMKTCRGVAINQTYFDTPDEGIFRLRKRGHCKNCAYIKTKKIKISDIKRIETETYISEKEYNEYISKKEYITGSLSKIRYCIVHNSVYYELDVYPFWNDKATIEIELLSEDQEYELPPFVKLIREVTFEKEYRNLSLAQIYNSIS